MFNRKAEKKTEDLFQKTSSKLGNFEVRLKNLEERLNSRLGGLSDELSKFRNKLNNFMGKDREGLWFFTSYDDSGKEMEKEEGIVAARRKELEALEDKVNLLFEHLKLELFEGKEIKPKKAKK